VLSEEADNVVVKEVNDPEIDERDEAVDNEEGETESEESEEPVDRVEREDDDLSAQGDVAKYDPKFIPSHPSEPLAKELKRWSPPKNK
jgi:hypothetical protein